MKKSMLSFATGLGLMASMFAHSFELPNDNGLITLKEAPKTIATYDLAILDSLHALDIRAAAVPKSLYTGALADYQQVDTVGSLFEPDYAKLKEVKPDLIFAGGRSARAIPELEKLAPVASFNVNSKNYLESFVASNLALAKAFGKEEKAQALLDNIVKNVEQLQKQNSKQTAAFLFVINGNIMQHVPGDRFGYAYELSGFTSVMKTEDMPEILSKRVGQDDPEFEKAKQARAATLTEMTQREPDWLLVLDRGAINDAEKTAGATLAKHPEISQTKAFKQGRVIYLEPNPWYVISGGLGNMQMITESLLAQTKR